MATRVGYAMVAHTTLKDIVEAVRDYEQVLREGAEADADLLRAKNELADCEELLARVESRRTLQAFEAEEVSGRNAEIRKVELEQILGDDKTVGTRRFDLKLAKGVLRYREEHALFMRATSKGVGQRLRALIAMAELLAALVVAEMEDRDERDA